MTSKQTASKQTSSNQMASDNLSQTASDDSSQTANMASDMAAAAAQAAAAMSKAQTAIKNQVLENLAATLISQKENIIAANKRDMESATNISAPLKERLLLDEKRIAAMAEGVNIVANLPDPIGEISEMNLRPSGIEIGKMRVPLGVVLAIYESRPNVTADIAALALKSGNAVILRGGSEAQHSNRAIGECLASALAASDLPPAAAQVVSSTNRALIDDFLACAEHIDLVIPRGGRALIERVVANARMPVLKHMDGNCHVYVDAAADLQMAEKIVINAKTRRYGVCNAAESLLVHENVAADFLPAIHAALSKHNVECRGCENTRRLIKCAAATDDDYHTEYLAPIISIKIVQTLDAAIAHINHYGSGHTDAIVTDDVNSGRRFLREVDSSSVMLNASTAFADGGEYGLGAEVGVSTDKFHARGPVGLAGLTCQKYIVTGNGSLRD